MSDRKTFEYGGYHFTPIRKFHKKEGDFFAISKRLASDPNLGLCTYQDRQKAPYDYKDFYTVSTDKECDIFRCEENGLLYVPGKNELFIYHEPKQKKRNSIADALSQPRNITDITGITAFKNIEELYLSSNKITDIDALTKLKKLNTLVISSNSIDNISMLPQIQTLKNLDLSYNQKLKNIEPLLKLKSLKLLCITDTGITQKDILKLKKALPYCEIIY